MLVVCCVVWVGVFGWRVFFRVVAGGIWGCGCRRPVPNLKIGGATPGGSGGRGVSPVFRFGAATPIHFDRIGVATPKNPCDRILGVATYHRRAMGVAATSNFGLQPLGVATPKGGGCKPNPLKELHKFINTYLAGNC